MTIVEFPATSPKTEKISPAVMRVLEAIVSLEENRPIFSSAYL